MKILVADSQGAKLSQAYAKHFGSNLIRGYNHPDAKTHSDHGAWCGWNACAPLIGTRPFELIFVQLFDGNGFLPHALDFFLTALEREAPDYVNMSWGAWADDELFRELLNSQFKTFVTQFKDLQERLQFNAFAAAGNDDDNNSRVDTAWPQRYLTEHLNIVGSTNARGFPSRFSGDGHTLLTMVGEYSVSLGMDGRPYRWAGTSSASPKALGVAAYRKLTFTEFREYVKRNTFYPQEFAASRPHPKWGYGSLEHEWQTAMLDYTLDQPVNMTFVNCLDGKLK